MRRILRIFVTTARIAGYPVREYVRRTLNLGVLHLLVVLVALTATVVTHELHWAWYGVIVAGTLGLLMVWRITGPFLLACIVPEDWQKKLNITKPINPKMAHDVSYWVFFVYMWALTPLIVTGSVPFWRYPWAYTIVLGLTICVLYIVGTREGNAAFWRKVYYSGVAVIFAGAIVAVIWPNTTNRFLASIDIGQWEDARQQTFDANVTGKIEARIPTVENRIAQLIDKQLANTVDPNAPWTKNDQDELGRLQTARSAMMAMHADIKTAARASMFDHVPAWMSNVASGDFDEETIFRMAMLLILGIVLVGGGITIIRDILHPAPATEHKSH